MVASALLKRFKVSVRNTASGLTYRTMGRKGYFHFPDLPAGTYHIKIKPSAALVRDPASFEVLRRLVKLPRAGAAEPAKFVFRLVKK
ncbi:MAG: hypothetical protein DCC75_04025 [Proteobacteria bacterium]|nr:MAG: hypothetical protein DCC75_04025 [Pseudomonadota bacterium]